MSEQCPFCQTQINDGAIVCIGCGAQKEHRGPNGSPGFSLILILLGSFFAFGPGIGELGVPLMIAGGIFLLLNYKDSNNLVWRRRY